MCVQTGPLLSDFLMEMSPTVRLPDKSAAVTAALTPSSDQEAPRCGALGGEVEAESITLMLNYCFGAGGITKSAVRSGKGSSDSHRRG